MEIANPIYDAVFDNMMKNNTVAKLLLSTIIEEEIVSLEPQPQEDPPLTGYRLNFFAKVKLSDGQYKNIIIDVQKAESSEDIVRSQPYLYEKYLDSYSYTIENEETDIMQVYAIYFLEQGLEKYDTPVLNILPEIRDLSTGKIIDVRNPLIDGLYHRFWIVQINRLKKPCRCELEQLVSIFDQNNRTSNSHILDVREEDFPKKYLPIIRLLESIANDSKRKK